MKPFRVGTLVQNRLESQAIALIDENEAHVGIVPPSGIGMVVGIDSVHPWYIMLLTADGCCGWTADVQFKNINE